VIDVPDVPPRRSDRKTCPYCEASAAGCRSNAWLRGRNCCAACAGGHDQATPHGAYLTDDAGAG
jgi:hypothetical protein